MSPTFLDTSFLLALTVSADSMHQRAVLWNNALSGTFITTDFILIEFANALSNPRCRPGAALVIESLRNSLVAEVIPAHTDLVNQGLALYRARPDKAWSLTDCISFHIMRDQNISNALTHDHHFEQAGFHALLRNDPPAN